MSGCEDVLSSSEQLAQKDGLNGKIRTARSASERLLVTARSQAPIKSERLGSAGPLAD